MKLVTHELGSGSLTAGLVHGASESATAWHDFARMLVDEFDLRLILVDQRGHGESPRAATYNISEFADDLVETLPVGLDFLFGQSLGGRTAALAAARLAPGHYIGVDPAFSLPFGFGARTRAVAVIERAIPRSVLRRTVVSTFGEEGAERQLANWANWDRRMIPYLTREGRRTEFLPQPPAVPSTVVLAENSFVMPPNRAKEFADYGWDIRTLAGAPHDMHIRNPAGLIDILRDVLTQP